MYKVLRLVLVVLAVILAVSISYAGGLIRSVEGIVVAVSDGDTYKVKTTEGTIIKVRSAGIDTPETPKYTKAGEMKMPGQHYGVEATKYVEDLILNRKVRVDIYGIDRYHRSLGFVFYNDMNINLVLVVNGLAEVYKGGEFGSYAKLLWDAQNRAQARHVGIWSLPNYESPRDYRKRYRQQPISED